MPLGQNYDYDLENTRLQRQMQMAEALRTGSLAPAAPTEVIDGYAVKKSPLDPIAKILQAFMANRQIDATTKQQQDLSARYKGDLKSGMGTLIDSMNAQPGVTQTVEDESGGHGAQVGATAQDVQRQRRDAILNAIASNHPVLQQLGTTMIGHMLKTDQMSTKDILGMADKWDPESLLQYVQTGNPQVLKPRTGHVVAGDQIWPEVGGKVGNKPVVDARKKYGPIETLAQGPNGPIVGQTEQTTNEAHFAPGGGVTVSLNTDKKAENALATGLAEGNAKRIQDSYATVKDVPGMLRSLDEAAANLDAGVKAGATADIGLFMAKAWKSLTGEDVDPTIANTETFRAKMAAQIVPIIEKLKPASDTDVKFAQEAAGGKITLDATTMARLIDSARAAGYNQLFNHNRLLDNMRNVPGAQAGGIEAYDIPFNASGLDPSKFKLSNSTVTLVNPAGISTPAKVGPGGAQVPAKPMSLDEYMKQLEGKKKGR